MFEEIVREVFADHDLLPSDVPRLDLYMDQVLTLFDEHLSDNKRSPDDKLMTKTMINNYSKEHLLMPVKGKKYTRQHIMQLLCIYQLKQGLLLSDIKALTRAVKKLISSSAIKNSWKSRKGCASISRMSWQKPPGR